MMPDSKIDWVLLIAVLSVSWLIAFDVTAFAIAMTHLTDIFQADLNTVQWVFNGYMLMFAMWVIPAGYLADTYGPFRMLIVGMSIFSVFALLGGFAQSIDVLIACRIAMGIGSAFLWPALLGSLAHILPSAYMSWLGGLMLGAAGLGNASGSLLSGVILAYVDWSWIMWFNVPVALIAYAFMGKKIGQLNIIKQHKAVNLWSIFLLMIAAFSLFLALYQIGDDTASMDEAMSLFLVFLVSFLLYLYCDLKMLKTPLIPRLLINNHQFRVILFCVSFISMGFIAVLVMLPHYLMSQLHFTSVEAGLALLPTIIAYTFLSPLTGKIGQYISAKYVVFLGYCAMILGYVLLLDISSLPVYGQLVWTFVLVGVGVGLVYPVIMAQAIRLTGKEYVSIVGGVVYMVRLFGGALGVALSTLCIKLSTNLLQGLWHTSLLFLCLLLIGLMVWLISFKALISVKAST
ncbi:MFS transporter [uncultured Shewanella sp.]|uniref:MFS transporter n=1 Tax=uncultured Shewanella sp. TaxID=173975 RepID=UPI002620891B|nr:MFS transporter [uncultured Shewanella sp.]